MRTEKFDGIVRGAPTLWVIDSKGSWHRHCTVSNTIMLFWGSCLAHMILGDTEYTPNGMYIEFTNVANPGDPVTVPTFARSENRDYYDNLPADQDFLRVALSGTPALSIETGYSDHFAADDGNKLTFTAQTAGSLGENGKPFSDANNSKVFGMALVAMRVPTDRTMDVIFARTYVAVDDQLIKTAGQQIGVTWPISFV